MITSSEIGSTNKNSSILYHMNEKESEQLKKCLMKILIDFVKVCNEYSFCYMLGGGSALGAVRHNGFIPWDDDIDVMMPREDYDKFVDIFEKELAGKYFLYVPNSKYEISNTYAKLVLKDTKLVDINNMSTPFEKGVWIDIFPIEYAAQNVFLRKIKGLVSDAFAFVAVSRFLYTYKNKKVRDFFYESKPGRLYYRVRIVTGFLFSFLGYKNWYNLYDKFVRGCKETNMWTIPTGRKHYFGEAMEKVNFVPTKKMKFEEITVNVPNNVYGYLRNLYGDYMKVPPVEKREQHIIVEFKL